MNGLLCALLCFFVLYYGHVIHVNAFTEWMENAFMCFVMGM